MAVREQDWEAIERSYFGTAPFNYAVIDDVLTEDVCAGLQAELINSWAWQLMNANGEELYIQNFESERVRALGEELPKRLPHIFGDFALQQYIAFWHHQNAGLYAHSDVGRVSLNLWLTADEYNRNPATGGMILHDVKRTDDMQVHEFNTAPWSTGYLASHTKGESVRIAYRCNRGVLFDARTFHATDTPLDFVNAGPESIRLNLNMMFDEPERFHTSLTRHYARGGMGE